MKKLKPFLCLVAIMLVTGINSCKKDLAPVPNPYASTLAKINALPDAQKVHPAEILSWIDRVLPADYSEQIKLTQSDQNVINNEHVVRIPIGKDAALFFTKTDGQLQVFAYKWLNKNPKGKLFTGYITAYSFQENNAKQFTYIDSKVIEQSYLEIKLDTKTIVPSHGPSAMDMFEPTNNYSVNETYSFGFIGQFWCWITGGTWNKGDGTPGNYGANGEVGVAGCDYAVTVNTIDMTSGAGGDYSFFSDGTFLAGDPYNGSIPPGGSNYGGGDGWVNVYVPDSGCDLNPDGTSSTICTPGYWVSFQIFTTPDIITVPVNDNSNIDDTDDTGNIVDTDCSSFIFTKTSVANWQEAGVTNIRLKWVWIGGGNGGLSRTVFLPSIVFGLPTQYQNSNGSITYLSAGQAAVKSAEITEIAKQRTYYEFRSSPYTPTDAEVLIYFKSQIASLMATQRGTAGATGSGSGNIIFKEEERSTFFPYSCGN
jgi:hypothetical protein